MTSGIGYFALASSLIGMLLLARGNEHGWKVRVFSGCWWVTYAVMLNALPLIVTSALYLCMDSYAVIRRWKRD